MRPVPHAPSQHIDDAARIKLARNSIEETASRLRIVPGVQHGGSLGLRRVQEEYDLNEVESPGA